MNEVEEQFVAAAKVALAAQDRTDQWPQSSGVPCATLSGAARGLRFERDLIRLGGLRNLAGKRVLDVGSGFGMALIAYVLLGASEAHGIEYVEENVDAVARYLPDLPEGLRERIFNRWGDAADIPYPDESFDVLFSVEAISHYADPPAFLAEAARVLRPGGLLLISDGNNGANPKVLRGAWDIWRTFEKGPTGAKIGCHTVRRSYVDMRRDAIIEAHPELDRQTVDRIAENTAGWTYERVLEATERFLRDGTLPNEPYREGELAMAPFGMAIERAFDPKQLARDLEKQGFRARAYGYWGGAAGQPMVRAANRVLMRLSRWTIPRARAFRVVASRS